MPDGKVRLLPCFVNQGDGGRKFQLDRLDRREGDFCRRPIAERRRQFGKHVAGFEVAGDGQHDIIRMKIGVMKRDQIVLRDGVDRRWLRNAGERVHFAVQQPHEFAASDFFRLIVAAADSFQQMAFR